MRTSVTSPETAPPPSFTIRSATEKDIPVVAQFLADMLQELASMGDHPACTDRARWSHVVSEIKESLNKVAFLHLLVETVAPRSMPVGWAYARIIDREPVYEPARVLHISALFVSRPYRKGGIGRALLEALVGWGRDSECVEAELNVLLENPACALYKSFGFRASHVKMRRPL
jgi:GNAT superfamily N-acetyltransferase